MLLKMARFATTADKEGQALARRLRRGAAPQPDGHLLHCRRRRGAHRRAARNSKVSAPEASKSCCSPIRSTPSGSRRRSAMTASRSNRSRKAPPTSRRSPFSTKPPSRPEERRRGRRIRRPRQADRWNSVVEDVRVSDRLSESAACLVAPEFGPDLRLQQILSAHGQAPAEMKPVLEVNPSHPAGHRARNRWRNPRTGNLFEDAVWLIFDEARLLDGAHAQGRRRFRRAPDAHARQSAGSLS